MNKKGFTLIEILAVIIIIGIVATIGIAAVTSNIDRSRNSSFSTLARNYAESARSMRGEDRLPHDPKDGEAVLIRVDALDGVTIENNEDFSTAYGKLLLDYSYVAIVNDGYNYKYYVSILDDTNHGIIDVEYSSITEKSVVADGDPRLGRIVNVTNLSNGVSVKIDNVTYRVTSVHNKYVVVKK